MFDADAARTLTRDPRTPPPRLGRFDAGLEWILGEIQRDAQRGSHEAYLPPGQVSEAQQAGLTRRGFEVEHITAAGSTWIHVRWRQPQSVIA